MSRRLRSPNYPAIDLGEAVRRASLFQSNAGDASVLREDALKALGYSGANGAALAGLSAVRKFGLLSRRGDEYRLSRLGLELSSTVEVPNRADLLGNALRSASLFAELIGRFGEQRDQKAVQDFLTSRGFAPLAVSKVTRLFFSSADYADAAAADPHKRPASLAKPRLTVLFDGAMIEVSARLYSPEHLDLLIEALTANRHLLKNGGATSL